MLTNFLGKLTGEAVRALARNLFPGFYERGISANKALDELKQAGLGYRRTDFLADFRSGKPGFDQATSIGRLGDQFVPRESLLKPQYYGTPDRYSFVFKASGTFTETGEEGNQYFTYHRNSLDTRANMESDAKSWLSEQADTYGFDAEDVNVVEGYINPIWA